MSLRLVNTPEITQLLFYWQNFQHSWVPYTTRKYFVWL